MMCSVGEYVDWAITAVNFAFFFINIRFLWRLRKEWDRVESAVRTAEAFRAQARKLRDEWKFAKMLSDATKDRT
jgi:hypothetical protein